MTADTAADTAADTPSTRHSAATAQALSAALLAEARAHVDAQLSNEAWMRANRHVLHPGAEFAFWSISGNNKLSLPEQHQLRNGYLKDHGWARVELLDSERMPAGSWALRFYL